MSSWTLVETLVPLYVGRPTSAQSVRESLGEMHPGLLAVGVRFWFY
ncbi:hypothetical protein PENANT_c033G08117 [Penicillium antarcticum]|uniref:Uncharacterized protein n=1 Tax=Penicillium antarcticum TaxID=416450 RepID=A0A1V6PUN8_9EURO|nr:hypothetical protein PENANT_c033G08117 [Penicillium antarcticum]